MPTYKITDTDSGQTLSLTGDSPPTEQELNNIFASVNTQQEIQQPQQELSEMDKLIAQRPDLYSQGIRGIQKRFSPEGIQQPQLTQFAQEAEAGLNILGGLGQRGIAAAVNPFIEAQQGRYNIPKSIWQGISGQKLGELGDVFRQTPVLKDIPLLPEAAGLVGEGMIGGALLKAAHLTKKANDFTKLQTTYGKDIAKNIIRQGSGITEPALEHGMKKGWKKILTKENLNPNIPTQIAERIFNNLDEITQKEYDEFGKVLSRIKTGKVKAIDLNQTIEDILKQGGYIDDAYKPTMKSRGAVVNKIQSFIDTAQKNKIKPDTDIPIDIIQTFKNILKGFVPEKNWIGKTRSLKGEQRLAKDLSNRLDDLIAYNAYGIEDEAYTQAKRSYSQFKNAEKQILDTFTQVVGQEVQPTGRKVVTLFGQHPTKANEDIRNLRNIGQWLKDKGYNDFSEKLMDWLTTQDFITRPSSQGLYPTSPNIIERMGKYLTRSALKTGIPSAIGSKTGKIVNQSNVIPASIYRIIRGTKRE